MQNLYVSLPQNVGGRPLVMLDAHTDEVGFMVQSITATGLLRIVPLGGWVEPPTSPPTPSAAQQAR